ncbi:spike base protein, RCAP_Rcc01079 family [Rhizobium sp. YTU87027]|uniref:spike base protein, RCAP_Rcc01079 family n=1 Tax=Rhizobium sp. YTU87027 TaxID=3417741 RepID=UPI003D68EA49
MSDRFASHAPSLTGPASAGFAVLPNDNLDLVEITRALYVGIGGELVVTMASGQTLTFASVSDGSMLPLRISRVHATGTTAESILGLT